MNKLLTIVIPTKNRYNVLFPTVKNILDSFPGRYDFEVVIQDNSEDNSIALEYLEEIGDERIIYNYKKEAISIVENTEIALSFGEGKYVVFIGDDDLVSPGIIEFLENISNENIDAIIYPPAYYWWTNIHFAKKSNFHQPGAFWFPKYFNRFIKWIDTKQELSNVLSQGAVAIYDLPRLYHGIVRRKVLDNIKCKSGKVVHGASPDMGLAITLGIFLDRHLKVDFPLTIYGASKNSGGGWTAEKKHYGALEEQKHLPASTINGWSKMVPRIWSEVTIYPQTAHEVLNSLKYKAEINYLVFYAGMIVNEPYLISYVLPFIFKYILNNPIKIIFFIYILNKKFLGKIKRTLNKYLFGMPFEIMICKSPKECTNYLKKLQCANICNISQR